MPPRGASRGQSAGRGRGRGSGPPSRPAPSAGDDINFTTTSSHITTIGVKRPSFGTAGRPVKVFTNHFPCQIPESVIHHYDVISPSEKLPMRFNMDLIRRLQTDVAPQIFTPRAVYDGRKNLFAAVELPFEGGSKEFSFTLDGQNNPKAKVFKIRLTKVAEINPEILARFLEGKQSHDNTVLTAITALNVVIRMEPSLKYPFNVRSFFTEKETKDIGGGLILWRGYFQSIRPAVGRMLINVDISTGTMYKPGSLLELCKEFIGRTDPNALAPRRGFPDRERIRLQRFLVGLRTNTKNPSTGQMSGAPRVIKKLSTAGAADMTFTMREGETLTVAEYFRRTYNRPLSFPDVLCVEVGSGALLPLEVCVVPGGQIMRKQVPPEKTKDVLEFATKKPQDRLASIRAGLQILSYGQSEYVRSFGLKVEANVGPLEVQARVLQPPTLKYGQASKQATVVPRDGAWNMIDKRFFKASTFKFWAVVVYERQQRFRLENAQEMVRQFVTACRDVGIVCQDENPIISYQNGQGRIGEQLRQVGNECRQKKGGHPTLIVVVLPEGGTDIYVAVKHFGDVTTGVATQCLKSLKCFKAKPQYFANVCLKVNVKLGGINSIPDPRSVSFLTEPQNPTIVMGCDIIHPAPGSEGRPSFASLVANVDSDSAKYIADSRVQTSRQEMVEDLQVMVKHMLNMYMRYRQYVEKKTTNIAPRRIIFYRDGVSEGQFKQVLEQELPLIQAACRELNITPTITIVVVGKRHHVRFFPTAPNQADRSGNCPAGTVVDREVVHPTEFDFYLQSHGGLLGTSRPAHYSVLYDENNFSPDGLQSLSYALCHVYARSTRSVSIPAPVYYADIVCARAKNHYDPQGGLDFSDSATNVDDQTANLEAYKKGFKPLHANMTTVMYFS